MFTQSTLESIVLVWTFKRIEVVGLGTALPELCKHVYFRVSIVNDCDTVLVAENRHRSIFILNAHSVIGEYVMFLWLDLSNEASTWSRVCRLFTLFHFHFLQVESRGCFLRAINEIIL